MKLTDREIDRYRRLRGDLRMTATAALMNARLYCALSDEQHEVDRMALSARLAAHREQTFSRDA